jgi:DNA-binding NarL/FixJ family response regulator
MQHARAGGPRTDQVSSILRKLVVRSRVEAADAAQWLGLVH